MDPMTMIALSGLALSAYNSFSGSGKKDKPQQIPTMTPEQQQHLNRNLQKLEQMGVPFDQAIQMLQGYMDPNSEQYKNFEAPYMQQFQQETLPGIAERFAGAGAQGGALSSSGFGQALGAAGSQLQTNLAGMKSQMGMNAANQLAQIYTQMSGNALGQQPFAYYQQDKGAGGGGGFTQGANQAGWDYLSRYGKDFGKGYQNQYPLTSYYDQQFRSGQLI